MAPTSPIAFLGSCRSLGQALQVHAQVVARGLHRHLFIVSKLVTFFALSNSTFGLDHSRLLFSLLDYPEVFLFNTMIRGYARIGPPSEAIAIFKSMSSPNNFTFPFLVSSCAKMPSPETGLGIHCHIVKSGFDSDIFVANSLVHFYSRFDDLSGARQLFDKIPDRDAVTYNTVINGYARAGRAAEALSLFKDMCQSEILPDAYTFVSLLSLSSSMADLPTGRFIHQLMYKNLPVSGVLLKNALVDMYAKCGVMKAAKRAFAALRPREISAPAISSMITGYAGRGEVEIARKLFDDMPVKDSIAWTAIIGGYSRAGRHREALELFLEMEASGAEPDEVTVSVALSACAQAGAVEMVKRLHRCAEKKSPPRRNLVLATAIVDAYAKCGLVAAATDVFRGVDGKSKTVPLFNAMISGLAQHGLGVEALATFREMAPLNLNPDEITFTAVLCACSHSGLIEEGKKIFNSMPTDHGIRPQMEHYGCMVDLLGRGGLLKEAFGFIDEMPIEPNSVIWHSLLAACRTHGDISTGEAAARRFLLLGPDGGSCVLLSGMLADAQRWEDSTNVRRLIGRNGNQKKPAGWSYIEWNGSLNQFLANDGSHPQTREIYRKLEEMAAQLKSAGYVPSTERVSFDIDEEEKEVAVLHHSEKLALAFGLITVDPGAAIRIFKNLRLCNDCHSSFKIVSKAYGREIIVRDRIRFHHMREGSCSCRDYW
ncbi:unnamed protein product [Spirodela intermedia]|uniref:DYW domain-containing protein n=1 Tax=Spirodela intermedia TaxID=51605 RepID=A0A7I8K212_SPIIN|nr:unnamed protein product [Spirodela intermedia]